jgi:hypothetical protein
MGTIATCKLVFLVAGSPLLMSLGLECEEKSVGRALSLTMLIVGMFMVLAVPGDL